MFRGRRRQANNNLGLALLAMQIIQFGVDRIPPVTLAALVVNAGVFLQVPRLFDLWMPKVSQVCVSYYGVVVHREYVRLLLSGLYHLSDMHLYYNMISFLYKGVQLEPRLGSPRFAALLSVLLVGCSAVYCSLQWVIAQALGFHHLETCAAGFSCVLFGLKVIMQDGNRNTGPTLLGMPLQAAYWSELIWISLISPNVSFVGHLSGIVMGLVIVYGPLNFLLTGQMPNFFTDFFTPRREGGAGTTTGGGGAGGSRTWGSGTTRQPPNDFDADTQEAMRRSRREEEEDRRWNVRPSAPPYDSRPHDHSQAPQLPLDFDEIRRRRVQRYQY